MQVSNGLRNDRKLKDTGIYWIKEGSEIEGYRYILD